MFPPRLILVLLIMAMDLAADGAEPLYQQFRPLGSLPWAKQGATPEQVIRRLYREPNQTVRSTLLEEYLKTVPAREFGQVFDLCVRLEEADAPDELLGTLMRAWGRIDPAAAWAKCKALHEIIVAEEPLGVDQWSTPIVIQNPKAVAASNFWPRDGSFADAFSEGVAKSALPQKEKDRYIALQKAKAEEWETAQEKAEGRTPGSESGNSNYQPQPPTAEDLAQQAASQAYQDEQTRKAEAQRKFVLEILACPPAEVRARLAAAGPDVWDDAVVARALIRWMDGDAGRGPEIVETVLDLVDPQGILRKTSTLEPIPIEFLMEWALLDFAGFRAWVLVDKPDGDKNQKVARPGLEARTKAVLQAIDFRDGGEWMGGVSDNLDEGNYDNKDAEKNNEAALCWAEIDPENALPWIWAHGGLRMYGEATDSAVYLRAGRRGANVERAIFATIDHLVVPIPEDPLSMIMEEWSTVDAVACARHGVRWCLRTGYFTKKRMIREWSGYESPWDGSVDDRHYGSLRIWAVRKPEEMRKWIRTEPLDEDVRKALLWLAAHAKGGFELRKVAPVKPGPDAEQSPKTP